MVSSPFASLGQLSNAEVMDGLQALVARERVLCAELIATLAEVDKRRLYQARACSSMFVFCRDQLHMAEGVAYKRIRVARTARRFPVILEKIAKGEIHLTAAAMLAPVLSEENHAELLRHATHKSKREVEELLAAWFPKPDAPTLMRKLPTRREHSALERSGNPLLATNQPTERGAHSNLGVPSRACGATTGERAVVSPERVGMARASIQSGMVSPLAADRYKVQFTVDAGFRDKLEEARALLRHQIPDGDIPAILEKALDLLVADVKQRRFGIRKSKKNRGKETARSERKKPLQKKGQRSRHIPNEVRREVAERDGLQCSFVDADGNRCKERGFLELHHEEPFGKGGAHDPENVRVFCRLCRARHNAHNAA